MHEYSLVQGMLEAVEREAASRSAVAVRRLQVRMGRFSGVEADLFTTAFEVLRAGTLCEHADLVLVREESEWRCDVCGRTLPPDEVLACPHCEWPARLARGDELILERIEMEVPHV
jgi:hydrogenase nickel incorporation protein HypA/HybF